MKKILLSLMLALTAMAAGAQTTFYWYYDEVNKEAYVMNHERWHEHRVNGDSWTSYHGGCHTYSGDVVVPDTAPNGYPVVGIYKSAFENCNNLAKGIEPLKSITLPKTVRTIGDRAFFGCSFLTEVVIPEGVQSIGQQAFQECKRVATLSLPSTLKLIDQNAFNWNQSLLHLTIPASVDSIGYAAFMHLDTLQTLTIEDGPTALHFDNGVGYGGEGMFGYHHHPYLKEAYIGRNITTPSCGLFQSNTHIRKVTFGDLVTSIRHDDFRYCDSLRTVTFGKGLKEIGNWAFEDCDTLQEIVLPEGLEYVATGAFEDCRQAKRLVLPSTLKLIDNTAFNNLRSITELTIPASVDSVGYAALNNLVSLKKLTIEDSENVLRLDLARGYGGEAMFSYDHQPVLDEVYVGRNWQSNPLFYRQQSITKLTFGPKVTDIPGWTCQFCDTLQTVKFGPNVKTIGREAFGSCKQLRSIVIPEGVETIDVGTFQYCEAATTLSLPSTVKLIDQISFRGCHGLKTLTIPASVDSIGAAAFMEMNGLERLIIADGESTLHFDNGRGYGGEGMFGYDHQPRLTYVHLGRNTTTPSSGVFAYSKSLRNVEMSNYVTYIRHDEFRYDDSLRTVRFSQNLREIGNWAFEDCDSLQAIDLPDAVETIGVGAFEDCVGAKRLHIPTSLKLIEQDAFRNIDGVTDLIIPANVDSIARGAFMDMDGLKRLVIKGGETTLHFANGRDYGGEAMFAFAHQPALEEAYVGRDYTSNPLFAENKTLRKVTMNNMPDIKASTFSGCTALEEATLGSATRSLARQAFYNCQSLKRLTVNAVEPPACLDTNYWIFYNVDQQQCQLAVPEGSIEAYKAHDVWKNFYTIESGVDNVERSTVNAQRVYDLSGHRVSTPQRGLNIVRMDDGTVRKVVVK